MTGLLQRWMARATRPPLHFEFFHQQQILTTNLFTGTLLSLTVRMPIPIWRIWGLNLPVTMIVDPLFSSLKTNLEIGACTEDGAVARQTTARTRSSTSTRVKRRSSSSVITPVKALCLPGR